jgi:GNAT superfamily N-acetyltransferase
MHRDDGYSLLIRQLLSADAGQLAAHFLALPADARYTRFFRPMSDTAIRGWVAGLRFDEEAWFGLYGFDGWLRGAVQAAPGADGAWELAFSVLPDSRRMGIGTALGVRVLAHLRARGARSARVACLAHNTPMRLLANRLGFPLRYVDGELHGRMDLAGRPGGGS